MIDAITFSPTLKPVATLPGLDAPFTYVLIDRPVPGGAPAGRYEVVAAFFDPAKPITSRADAFLEASRKFEIGNRSGSHLSSLLKRQGLTEFF
jgi:hypothetical protein